MFNLPIKRNFPILLLLFTGIAHGIYAQTPLISQLKQSLDQGISNAERTDKTLQLSQLLYSHDLEVGFTYAQQSLKLASDESDTEGMAKALTSMADYYYYRGDMQSALSHDWRARSLAKGSDFNEYPARTFLHLSLLHRVMANFDSAKYYNQQVRRMLNEKSGDLLYASLWESEALLKNCFAHNEEAIRLLRRSAGVFRKSADKLRLAHTFALIGSIFEDMASYDSSNYYLDKAELLAEAVNDPVLNMLVSLSRGETYFSMGNFNEAIIEYSQALEVLEDHPFQLYYGIALFKIGEVYENEGIYHSAYELFYNSIKELEKMHALQEIQRTYTQIGWCYAYQENYTLALDNARLSLNTARQIKDSSSIAQNMNLAGYVYYKTAKYDEALQFFDQAIAIRRVLKDWYGYSFSVYNLGLVYLSLENEKKASDLFLESLAVDKRVGKKIGVLFTSNTLGHQYAKAKKYPQASAYLAEANRLANEIPVPAQLLTNYKHYIFLYESQNNSARANVYYRLYMRLQDSLSNEASASRVAKDDALFQLQKKANEIKLINKENELHQEVITVQKSEITFQRLVIFLGALGIASLAVFSVVIFRLFRSNKRARQKLDKQNAEIMAQQEEIQIQSEKLKVALDSLENINNSLEKRVSERTRELNQAYTELETFFYHTSHDFRRPLTTYLGLAEIARATLTDEKALQLFDQVRQTTVGLDNMLIKLQSIGNVNYHDLVREIELLPSINACVEKFKHEIVSRNIAVHSTASVKTLFGNPFLLNVVLENLIENAVLFSSPANPHIEIDAHKSIEGVAITIGDNGQGIDERWHGRLFEMYFRANANSKGNGLGLYIAKRAVEKMGGTLSFKSVLNEGSTFTVHLPTLVRT